MTELSKSPGRFGPDDKKIAVAGINVSLGELAKTLIDIRDNENNRTGGGWQNQHGDSLFKTMLWKIHQGIDLETLKPFLVPGFKRIDFENADSNPKEWNKVFCDRCGKAAYCQHCKKYIQIRRKNEKP